MQTETISAKVLGKLGDAASTLMVAMVTVMFIWLRANFIVAIMR